MNIIVVTGTPGTGKTTLSKLLGKKLNFYYLDVNNFISKHKLSEGYDRKMQTKIIDVNKLNDKLINEIKLIQKSNKTNKYGKFKQLKGIIIDSHLSHYLPRKYADFCIVAKCGIKELNKRLNRKKFHQSKIKENIEAEIFDVCLNEAKQRKHKIITIDTTKGFNINRLIKRIGGQ
ncbi:MAG TPA: AAA family ATPase [Candidatus Nanoarchaeia archaeon]|nr:AAA family ATPase [Candidatus Nanoarchaeia archaeon]